VEDSEMIRRIKYQQIIDSSLKDVWDYFATPLNLNSLTPPDMQFQIIYGGEKPMYEGQLIEYRIQFMPFLKSRWLTEITHIKEQTCFIDEQRIGPYQFWHHEHLFKDDPSGVQMTDLVTYLLPFGPLGDLLHKLWIGPRLKTIFDYRASQVNKVFPS
jgi:ligand-binding SRPBCC domain-containing protein